MKASRCLALVLLALCALGSARAARPIRLPDGSPAQPSSPSSASRRLLQAPLVCIRPLNIPFLPDTSLLVHCYIEAGGWSTAFDSDGVHPETDFDLEERECYEIGDGVSAEDLQAAQSAAISTGAYDGDDYDWNDHNCCHYTQDVLLRAGASQGVESYFPAYSLPPDLGPI